MTSLVLRLDLTYPPWGDRGPMVSPPVEPSYIVKVVQVAREADAKLQFFVSADSARAFPDMADVLVGEGHAVDALLTDSIMDEPLDERAFSRLLTRAEKAFRDRQIALQGLAVEQVGLTDALLEALIGHYQWIAVRDCAETTMLSHAGLTVHCSAGPSDQEFASNHTPSANGASAFPAKAFADHAWAKVEHREIGVINLSPRLLAHADPACVVIRALCRNAAQSGVKIVTFRDV